MTRYCVKWERKGYGICRRKEGTGRDVVQWAVFLWRGLEAKGRDVGGVFVLGVEGLDVEE